MLWHDRTPRPSEGSSTSKLFSGWYPSCSGSWMLSFVQHIILRWFWEVYTRLVSREATLSTGIMTRKNKIDKIAKPLAARAYGGKDQLVYTQHPYSILPTTTPWSQAKIASSYNRVTRSHLAVIYPATKIPRVRIEKGCMNQLLSLVHYCLEILAHLKSGRAGKWGDGTPYTARLRKVKRP